MDQYDYTEWPEPFDHTVLNFQETGEFQTQTNRYEHLVPGNLLSHQDGTTSGVILEAEVITNWKPKAPLQGKYTVIGKYGVLTPRQLAKIRRSK